MECFANVKLTMKTKLTIIKKLQIMPIISKISIFKKHYLIVHGNSMYYMLKINFCQLDISKAFGEIFSVFFNNF